MIMKNNTNRDSELSDQKSKIENRKSSFSIIPAIDIIDGKCVRLTQGDYSQKKIYSENPLEVALDWNYFVRNRKELLNLISVEEFIERTL